MSRRTTLLLPLLGLLLLLAIPTVASAKSFKWGTAKRIEPSKDGGLNGVSCPNQSFCVAVDQSGNVLYTTTAKSSVPKWTMISKVDTAASLVSVSCPTSSFCAAVDQVGALVTSSAPTKGAKYWTKPVRIDATAGTGGGYAGLASISCASSTECVAVDNAAPDANLLYSSDPAGGKGAWHTLKLSGTATSVSCNTHQCVAVGSERYISTTPTSATSWKASGTVTGGTYSGASCINSVLCVAVGYGNTSPGFENATKSPTGTWGATFSVALNPPAAGTTVVDGVGCTQGRCIAVDGADNAYVSHTPTTGVWGAATPIRKNSASARSAISCTGGMCVVVDSAGVETTGALS